MYPFGIPRGALPQYPVPGQDTGDAKNMALLAFALGMLGGSDRENALQIAARAGAGAMGAYGNTLAAQQEAADRDSERKYRAAQMEHVQQQMQRQKKEWENADRVTSLHGQFYKPGERTYGGGETEPISVKDTPASFDLKGFIGAAWPYLSASERDGYIKAMTDKGKLTWQKTNEELLGIDETGNVVQRMPLGVPVTHSTPSAGTLLTHNTPSASAQLADDRSREQFTARQAFDEWLHNTPSGSTLANLAQRQYEFGNVSAGERYSQGQQNARQQAQLGQADRHFWGGPIPVQGPSGPQMETRGAVTANPGRYAPVPPANTSTPYREDANIRAEYNARYPASFGGMRMSADGKPAPDLGTFERTEYPAIMAARRGMSAAPAAPAAAPAPAPAPMPSSAPTAANAALIAEAKAALAKGAPKAAVADRLRSMGVDPRVLD